MRKLFRHFADIRLCKCAVHLHVTLHFPGRTTNVIPSASAKCNVLSAGVWPVCVNFKWMSVPRDFQCIIALRRHHRVGSAVRAVSVASDWQINVSTPRRWAHLAIATCLFEMMHNTMDNGQLVSNYQVELSLCCNHRQETGSKLLSVFAAVCLHALVQPLACCRGQCYERVMLLGEP